MIKLVHSIVAQAADAGASDVHFEPVADHTGRPGRELRVRMRVDGVLVESMTVPQRLVRGVVSRIKIMADLDISVRRLPQNGRVGLTVEGRQVDVRVITPERARGDRRLAHPRQAEHPARAREARHGGEDRGISEWPEGEELAWCSASLGSFWPCSAAGGHPGPWFPSLPGL
ncbi:MAG: Flp pilus assembly complex ATPase component TadA [Actinomycetota bacterium]|nr:Flp pilus assembly complex ATPase component TadA [Actinomycetota bacterium]